MSALRKRHANTAKRDFADWASLFSGGRFFVNLVVCADESGHHDTTGNLPGSNTPVICGLAGTAKQWEKFCGDWQRILNSYAVPYFHFNEWNTGAAIARGVHKPTEKNVYKALSHERINKLLMAVCKLIGSTNFISVGVSIPIKQEKPPLHPHKELAALFFEKLVLDIRSGRPNWDGGITVIYDEPDKGWRSIICEGFYAAKENWPQLQELTFGGKTKFLGLHAADLIAYRYRQLFDQNEGGGLYFPFAENDRYLFKSMFGQFAKHGFEGPFMPPMLRPKPSK